jgi:hypothetical protein
MCLKDQQSVIVGGKEPPIPIRKGIFLYLGTVYYSLAFMSSALAHQSKNNSRNRKTSTPPTYYSSIHHRINNLNRDSPNSIFQLQQGSGNQAVQRLIRANNVGFDFAKIGILQPKLKVSQSGDKYEQEADKVAEQVVRISVSSNLVMPIETTKDEGTINRKCAACETKEEEEEEEDEKQLNINRKA